MKARKPNTPETKMTGLDAIDTDSKAPFPVKLCDRFGPSCSFCKQGTQHRSPQESDWSSKDWDGTKTETKKETGETNLLSDQDWPKPQSEPDPRTEVDKLHIDKLHIEQDSPKEEQVEVTDLLIPLPTSEEEKATMEGTMGETMEETMEELTVDEKRYQLEEEKYVLPQKAYLG